MPRRRAGFTLVEVIISVLLTAVMVSGMMSIALTAKMGGAGGDAKLAATIAGKRLGSALRQYVTTDPTVATIAGPNSAAGSGMVSWSFISATQEDHKCNIDASGKMSADSGARDKTLAPSGLDWQKDTNSPYALAAGRHCLKCTDTSDDEGACILPVALRSKGGEVNYEVTYPPGPANSGAPQTQMWIYWDASK